MHTWPVFNSDVRTFDYSFIPENIALLAAGVPCQPFSIGGKHRGHRDERNMFPELIRAIRQLKPQSVLVENVRGLARPSFSKYFGYIELMLSYPEIRRKNQELWHEHLSRLERYHTRGKRDGLFYRVVHRVLNAADYGVPQKRERLFMVAIRADLGVEWSFPTPTHSAEALARDKGITGQYWDRHSLGTPNRSQRKGPSSRKREREVSLFADQLKPWVTVRDALAELGPPALKRGTEEPARTHFLIPGARSYIGHTGSPLDEPAKTLKAGVHGVPGGENMLAKPDGTVRYFTIRESARLQTFPDEYIFCGSWTESMRQIGNAVPVSLAQHLATDVRRTLALGTLTNGAYAIQSSR